MPPWVSFLPSVNASLNGAATVLLIVGYVFIRNGKVAAHKRTMLSAFGVSMAFLVCYVVYHSYAGSKSYPGSGTSRAVYLTILVSHVVLAATVPWLAMATIYRGLKGDWERHRKIAKVTYPIWLYVSVTGVIIYIMLYHGPAAF